LHVVQIRAKSNGAYFVIQEPQIVGEFDLASQKDQMAYYEGQAIMFQDADHLGDKNRFLSYWQVSDTGIIKSYFTGLTLASRTNQVSLHTHDTYIPIQCDRHVARIICVSDFSVAYPLLRDPFISNHLCASSVLVD